MSGREYETFGGGVQTEIKIDRPFRTHSDVTCYADHIFKPILFTTWTNILYQIESWDFVIIGNFLEENLKLIQRTLKYKKET